MTGAPAAPGERLTIAYVMSRFPKLTETFVLEEMRAVARRGHYVVPFPLRRERPRVQHPEAGVWLAEARWVPFLSPGVLVSNAWFLRHRPRRYLAALRDVLVGTWGSARFFAGAVAMFPKLADTARRMEGEGVQHVHCHFATHPAVAGFVVHRLTGIPYSFTAHGSDLHKDRHMLPAKVREAAFVVAISAFNRQVIVDTCGARAAGKVQVLRCGVDTGALRPADVPPAGTPLRLLAIGTLHAVKGHRHLLDACARAVAAGVDLTLEIVGDGPDRGALEAQAARLGLGDRVRFLGARPGPDVRAALHRAQVLVAPSVPTRDGRREGIPVVLMEAMSCGLPVVSSRLSGIPELVEDGVTGLLTEPGDVEGLAAMLKRLAVDPELRARLGAAGRAHVERHHDLQSAADELVALVQGARR